MGLPPIKARRARRGTTILELILSFGILTTILLATFGVIQRDTQLASSTLGICVAEMKAQQMLREIETHLANARGANPLASITEDLGASETGDLAVDMTLGFPDQGSLLLGRGTSSAERIAYASLDATQDHFLTLLRGQQGTDSSSHAAGEELLWCGLAEPIELQVNPPPTTFDGIAMESRGPVFYRGDGIGFSFRIPVDPTDSVPPVYLDEDELQWGHELHGTPSTDAWACLHYVPRFTYAESTTGDDINRDGDTTDVFEVGQIRRRIWDTTDPTVPPADLGLGPTNVLQEQSNRGGDLDGDGFNDPIFLWDRESRQLHVRLFVLGRTNSDVPIVRKVESLVFLRNEPEN